MTHAITLRQAESLWGKLPEHVEHVEVALGANPAFKRHFAGVGVGCVVYLRTGSGILGSGAHPGFIVELTEDVALELGFSADEILSAAGCPSGYAFDSGGQPLCSECLALCGEYEEDASVDERAAEERCWSCEEMIRESWARAQRDLEYDDGESAVSEVSQ